MRLFTREYQGIQVCLQTKGFLHFHVAAAVDGFLAEPDGLRAPGGNAVRHIQAVCQKLVRRDHLVQRPMARADAAS